MDEIYIARQPIYDRALKLVGYELLYRNSQENHAQFEDGEKASSDAIVNSFIHIGIDNLVGTSLAFVNLPTEFIVDNDLVPMFHEQSVLEILENVEPTDDVIAGIKGLKDKGYKIALDDFVLSDNKKVFLPLADFVKVDVLDYSDEELPELVSKLRQYDVDLVAEKVETQQLFQTCKSLDFDYYQGYFFCRPQLVTEKNMPASKLVVLNLIAKLQNPEAEISEIESVLSNDVALSYKLLRYINSAAFSLRREIESIKDAIVLLGLATVKNWASLILMSRVASDKPQQLVITALVRAKMAELLAEKEMPGYDKQAFICGLFSVLDALMDRPMIDLLDTVILSTQIKLALLDYEGELGQLLENTLFYEQANFDALHQKQVNTELYYESYMAAIKWADVTMKELSH